MASLLAKLFGPKSPRVPLDLQNPVVQELSAELQVLDVLPIATKEEREAWESARQSFEKKLRSVWSGVYDSLPHEIEHYLCDVDIRARDAGYARYQRERLACLLTPENGSPSKQPDGTSAKARPSNPSHGGRRPSSVSIRQERLYTSPRRRAGVLGGLVASIMLILLGSSVIIFHRLRWVELSPETSAVLGALFCVLGLALAFSLLRGARQKRFTR